MEYNNLRKYGFAACFEHEAALFEGLFPARVTEQHRDLYTVATEAGEIPAAVSGRFAFRTDSGADFPAVGDWVMTDKTDSAAGNAVIHHVLTRKSLFERRAAGTAPGTQIVAANIDVVFICMSLNADFNLRRLERYLAVAWNSMAKPVIVLTKADLCPDIGIKLADVSAACAGADVVVCSSLSGSGYREVLDHIPRGETAAFIGSSGVGKSTLINRLLDDERLDTRETRRDDRGRHTTTHRQLLLLPSGGIVIDTPGMRELQLESGNLSKTFEDIAAFAVRCRYRDCSHTVEPGCAVREAVENGGLPPERLASYEKLRRELNYEGMNFRQLEQEKLRNMFGSKGEYKQAIRCAKNKNK